MKFTHSNYKLLGVINRTPNSFSCTGFSLIKDHLFSQLKLHDRFSAISDLGFESTAPMNQAITREEELSRFFEFLNLTKSHDFSGKIVSFDTYRPSSFLVMSRAFLSVHPRVEGFIFNDVSGVLDEELKQILLEAKRHFKKEIFYVYSFCFVPNRKEVLKHNKMLRPGDSIIEECVESFKKAANYLEDVIDEKHLILDPGFGFSKTYEQNWELIYRFSYFLQEMEKAKLKNTLLIGLSKKSFLRAKLGTKNPEETEELHQFLLKKMIGMSSRNLLLRVHNPALLSSYSL